MSRRHAEERNGMAGLSSDRHTFSTKAGHREFGLLTSCGPPYISLPQQDEPRGPPPGASCRTNDRSADPRERSGGQRRSRNARPDFVELVCNLTQSRPGGDRAGLGSKPTQKGGVVVISKGAFFRRSGHSGRPLLIINTAPNSPVPTRRVWRQWVATSVKGAALPLGGARDPLKALFDVLTVPGRDHSESSMA